jgi:hypothetical protein
MIRSRLQSPIIKVLIFYVLLLSGHDSWAQVRCGSMELQERKWQENPALRTKFLLKESRFQERVAARLKSNKSLRTGGAVTIPVVFHLVLSRQSMVTDAQVLAQLDTLNKDYAGTNGSASRIPAYFKSLFGQSGIQFCLAQQQFNGEPSTGIVRYTTSQPRFDYRSDDVKHRSRGGADAWDTDNYLNIWITDLADNILGYATFPDDGVKDEQGVVISYTSLPGGSATAYNQGKTLTHEVGHYFNLYHTWGDDYGDCYGSDYIADTPNQADYTKSCKTGIVTDDCTPSGNGIMYQNYMDYTPDACLMMFTVQQVVRMETAFANYRSLLASSKGCTAPDLRKNDASLQTITTPDQRICSGTFSPIVTIQNTGSVPLTQLTIRATLSNGTSVTHGWTGNLVSFGTAAVTLPSMTVEEGDHLLSISTSLPNGVADDNPSNDALSRYFIYYNPFEAPVVEGFETSYPSRGWDIVNEDGGSTWEQTSVASKTGARSLIIKNSENTRIGERDYLRSPRVTVEGVDSIFVSFQVAAAAYTNTGIQNNVWDTLQVLVSTNCGQTYTPVYKKWGAELVTRAAATRSSFVPLISEWRQERIDISEFAVNGTILVAFLNTNGNENDIYLDDIAIRTVTVNPILKEERFLVTPSPTNGTISVQLYPQPSNLKGIYIYSVTGQLLKDDTVERGGGSSAYEFDLSSYPSGIYIVQVVFADRVLNKKIIKY